MGSLEIRRAKQTFLFAHKAFNGIVTSDNFKISEQMLVQPDRKSISFQTRKKTVIDKNNIVNDIMNRFNSLPLELKPDFF